MAKLALPLKLALSAVLALAALAAAGAVARELFLSEGPTASSVAKRAAHGFKVRGNLRRPLRPGATEPLNLRLTNPHRFGIEIRQLRIDLKVDAKRAVAGCRASPNFKVSGLSRRAYPLRLGPRRARTLRQLGVKPLPRVTMLDLPTNQDACKSAKLTFRYGGRAQRWPRGRSR